MDNNANLEIIGRCMDGVYVSGYVVLNINNNKRFLVDRSGAETLALGKMIRNVHAQVYGDKVIMKGIGCKLSQLPSFDVAGKKLERANKKEEKVTELRLSARILNGKTTVGYVITLYKCGKPVESKAISRDKVLELARNGDISNARVQLYNGKYILRGVGCELAHLRQIKQ